MLGFAVRSVGSHNRNLPFLCYLVDSYRSAPWWYFLDVASDSDDYFWLYCFGTRRVMMSILHETRRRWTDLNTGPMDLSWYWHGNGRPVGVLRFFWFEFRPTREFLARFPMVVPDRAVFRFVLGGEWDPRRFPREYWEQINRSVRQPQNRDSQLMRRSLEPVRNAASRFFDSRVRSVQSLEFDGSLGEPYIELR